MAASPIKDDAPVLAPRVNSNANTTSSPSHRSLRRLKSAHALRIPTTVENFDINPQPLIVSHHKQGSPRHASPVKKDPVHNSTLHTRTRSNSDALIMPSVTGVPVKRPALGKRLLSEPLSLDRLIRDGPSDGVIAGGLDSMRLKILDQGIKSDSDGMSALRIYIWLILLNAPLLDTDDYLGLIHRGASPAYSKIRNDTFRTLATDPLFRRRVSEASLIRLLNAVAWKLHDAKEERNDASSSVGTKMTHTADANGSPELTAATPVMHNRARALTLTTEGSEAGTSEPGIYVQGMNVLAAPFLYAARSEAEAFAAFYRFITTECPGYVRGAMSGVHKGLALVDKVLAIVDPKLSMYLISKGMHAEIYAFPSVLTLCACTPPLPEVLRLWDFLFAYGAHLNILCIVAQLVILRNSILSSPSPTKILRSFPPLNAELIKEVTLTVIKKIPEDVYAEIVVHAK